MYVNLYRKQVAPALGSIFIINIIYPGFGLIICEKTCPGFGLSFGFHGVHPYQKNICVFNDVGCESRLLKMYSCYNNTKGRILKICAHSTAIVNPIIINIPILSYHINRIRMFVCLSVGYTLLIKPNSIHMLYMGRSGIYRGRFLSKN